MKLNAYYTYDEMISALESLAADNPRYMRLEALAETPEGRYVPIVTLADFDDPNAYKVVTLADSCIQQQIHEGWFKTPEEAFKQAISMTCQKIMECKTIISVVPYAVKAKAIHDTLTSELSNMVPATLMKQHGDVTVYCDADSAALVPQEVLDSFQ